jgi:hypothetical protein
VVGPKVPGHRGVRSKAALASAVSATHRSLLARLSVAHDHVAECADGRPSSGVSPTSSAYVPTLCARRRPVAPGRPSQAGCSFSAALCAALLVRAVCAAVLALAPLSPLEKSGREGTRAARGAKDRGQDGRRLRPRAGRHRGGAQAREQRPGTRPGRREPRPPGAAREGRRARAGGGARRSGEQVGS